MKISSVFSFIAFAAFVSAAPQPLVTPAVELEARSLYDTGLNRNGHPLYITFDEVGELKSAAEAGEDVESVASTKVTAELDSYLGAISPLTSLDAQQSSSIFVGVHSLLSEAASIANLTDSAAYRSAGASYTSKLVHMLSTQTGITIGGQADSSVHGAVPAAISLLAAVAASFWMIL